MATDKKRNRAGGTKKNTRPKKNPEPTPPPLIISNEELYLQVATKAYELYQQRGEEHGHDLNDWFTAERLVKEELLHGPVSEEPLLEEL